MKEPWQASHRKVQRPNWTTANFSAESFTLRYRTSDRSNSNESRHGALVTPVISRSMATKSASRIRIRRSSRTEQKLDKVTFLTAIATPEPPEVVVEVAEDRQRWRWRYCEEVMVWGMARMPKALNPESAMTYSFTVYIGCVGHVFILSLSSEGKHRLYTLHHYFQLKVGSSQMNSILLRSNPMDLLSSINHISKPWSPFSTNLSFDLFSLPMPIIIAITSNSTTFSFMLVIIHDYIEMKGDRGAHDTKMPSTNKFPLQISCFTPFNSLATSRLWLCYFSSFFNLSSIELKWMFNFIHAKSKPTSANSLYFVVVMTSECLFFSNEFNLT
ncbi:hypothetical protein IEQ34_008971 [Dendrobium chrysotoxum]|uniref:Uncharacterized protein n=1 Tax=Dendrobium chrysotoxum TaxID=161865 RepID=A0AAV7GXF3_DENCH|nr:hypothetical protein IEQ34_008971 [Dendrobium chrysotoxum]